MRIKTKTLWILLVVLLAVVAVQALSFGHNRYHSGHYPSYHSGNYGGYYRPYQYYRSYYRPYQYYRSHYRPLYYHSGYNTGYQHYPVNYGKHHH